MSIKVLIADDEPLARSRLRTLLGDCRQPAAWVAGEAESSPQAISMLLHQSFDVAFLDIQMPGANGIRLASQLKALPEPPLVIFVTAHAGYAVEAFEVEAVDYLTKPVRLERLQAALLKAERKLATIRQEKDQAAAEPGPQWLLVSERGGAIRVPLSEVLYLKAELKYVTVRTAKATHLMDGSLNQFEEKFPGRFLRIHRNTLVSREGIRALVRQAEPDIEEGEGWAVRIEGIEDVLPVSRRQVTMVREALGESA